MNLQPNGFFVLTRGRCVTLREIKFRPQKFEKSTTHTVTKNVGVRKAHGLLFMGDNFKTTLKSGKDCCEYSHFQWTLQRDSTPLIHMCFACVFRPAGSVKWDACAQVRPRHNSRMFAISSLHFSFQRQIVMLARQHGVNSSWKSVT